jgi:hypothetical protein
MCLPEENAVGNDRLLASNAKLRRAPLPSRMAEDLAQDSDFVPHEPAVAYAGARRADDLDSTLTADLRNARICDQNLVRIRRHDPDADRLFTVSFADAVLGDDDAVGMLGEALAAYGAAKHQEGRMDRFFALFDGVVDEF